MANNNVEGLRKRIACTTCGWRNVCGDRSPIQDGKPSGDTCSIQLQTADRVLQAVEQYCKDNRIYQVPEEVAMEYEDVLKEVRLI